mmetsp:Transcript_3018/g.6995  ORF Transcript_3018/g.6995 Transcript_3018/m.6995 type:complete len:301 (+) Transcript_3018:262-1164(+)|eukprot:g8420.t1
MQTAGLPSWKLHVAESETTGQLTLDSEDLSKDKMRMNFGLVYGFAALGFWALYATFHDIGLSTFLTFSVLIQSVALVCLLVAILTRRSVRGVSALSIAMQGLSFLLRLGTTSWLRGYIPVDSTGDCLYQFADIFALVICSCIVHLCVVKFKGTYQSTLDTFPVAPTIAGCIVAAILIHPDLNNRPFFDGLWACSLYVDVMSTMPQLWMIHKAEGKIDALSAHYVFLVAISRLLDTVFWWFGYEELAPENGGWNISGYTVLGANVLHIVLMGDFVTCYVRNVLAGRFMHHQFDFNAPLDVV